MTELLLVISNDPVVDASIITLFGVLGSAAIGGIFTGVYFWWKDPAAKRNGVVDHQAMATERLADATEDISQQTVKLALSAERLNSAHDDFKDFMVRTEERNHQQHTHMLELIERLNESVSESFKELLDLVAPRKRPE